MRIEANQKTARSDEKEYDEIEFEGIQYLQEDTGENNLNYQRVGKWNDSEYYMVVKCIQINHQK